MSNARDSLGDRMKKYEYITRTHLIPRTPVIIRLDGRAFHTFTKGFKRPFDLVFAKAMQETMKHLCESIQGCVLGYTQSDEITLVLVDYQTLDTDGWFDYNIQKVVSIAAASATLAFNRALYNAVSEYLQTDKVKADLHSKDPSVKERTQKYVETLKNAVIKGGMFDARCFNLPKEEVANCLLWRQNDATRNSIESVGQAYFSAKQLHEKSCKMIQDMLLTEKNINWNNYPTMLKRGCCCVKVSTKEDNPRQKWIIDREIPIFKGEGRDYINSRIYVGE